MPDTTNDSSENKMPVTRDKRFNELWLTEESSEGLRLSLKVTGVLCSEKTKYQDILIVDTPEYGRTLMLDGAFQLTERDEFCYSEMMAHVPLCAHPEPKRVPVSVSLTNAEIIRKVHFCAPSRSKTTAGSNTEKIIFTATDSEVKLTFTDVKAKPGCCSVLNYVALRPYFEP